MHFFGRLTAFIFLSILIACGSAEQDAQNATTDKERKNSDNTEEATALIVTASEKYESLMVKTVGNAMENVNSRDTVDLRSQEGVLCQNRPRNPEVHYGFQASQDLSRYFIAMYEGNMMRQEFEWCRLYEYNPADDEWIQLISFGNIYRPIWKYVEEADAVVYYDKNAGLLLSHHLEEGTTDTIQALSIENRQHALSSNNGQVQLTYADDGQIRQLTYDTSNENVEEQLLASAEEFSSIYQDYVLQVYFTDPENQGFRLYEGEELIADQPFTVGNVNSFWNEEGQFYLLGEQEIFLMNPQLDTLQRVQMNSPFIYNVLDEYVLAHERSQQDKSETQAFLLTKDLSDKQQTDLLEDAAWTVLVKDI